MNRRALLTLVLAAAGTLAFLLASAEPPIEPEWDHQIPEVILWEA